MGIYAAFIAQHFLLTVRQVCLLFAAGILASCSGGGSDPATGVPGGGGANEGIQLAVQEISPATGVTASTVFVKGTYLGPSDTKIMINGMPACLAAGTFFANNVMPLEAQPSLDVTASATGGVAGHLTRTLTFDKSAPTVRSEGTPCGGPAPHVAAFDLTFLNIDLDQIVRVDVYVGEDNAVDYQVTNFAQPINHTYISPGLYTVRFVARLTDQSSLETRRLIHVTDPAFARQPFDTLYSNLRTALANKNVALALPLFMAQSQPRFKQAILDLGDQLPAYVNSWSDFEPVVIDDRIAYFSVTATVDGQREIFTVTFLRDRHGDWKISSL